MMSCILIFKIWLMLSVQSSFQEINLNERRANSTDVTEVQEINHNQFVFDPKRREIKEISNLDLEQKQIVPLPRNEFIPTDILRLNDSSFWVLYHDQPGIKASEMIHYDQSGKVMNQIHVDLYGLNELVASNGMIFAKSGDVNEQMETGIVVVSQNGSKQKIVRVKGMVSDLEIYEKNQAIILTVDPQSEQSHVWLLNGVSGEILMIDSWFPNICFDANKQLLQIKPLISNRWLLVVKDVIADQETVYLFDSNETQGKEQLIILYKSLHVLSIENDVRSGDIGIGMVKVKNQSLVGELYFYRNGDFQKVDKVSLESIMPERMGISGNQIWIAEETKGYFACAQRGFLNSLNGKTFDNELWMIRNEQ